MRVLRAAAVRLRSLVRRREADDDVDAELRYHLARDVERRVAAGMSVRGATAAARREFGNVTLLAEQSRDAARIPFAEQLGQDLRYAVRGFRAAPRFALTVVLTIGLGLGLVTTAFTIFDAYVLRVLEVRDPRSLYEVQLLDRRGQTRLAAWREYEAVSRANPALTESFAYRSVIARRNGEPVMLHLVTGNYFRMLGVQSALGRTIEPGDADRPGAVPVLVLSHRAWSAKYGGDSSVIGHRLLVRDRTFEIVGVAREGFGGTTDMPPDAWAPLTMANAFEDDADLFGPEHPARLKIIGRLKAGMPVETAEQALSAWARHTTAEWAERVRVTTVALESRATATHMSPQTMAEVSPLFLAFVLVLLMACANVANMMLARGMARQREFGIRLALGAARGRLVRQLMTEALLLAVPAGVVGLLASRLALDVGVKVMFATVPEVFVPYLRVLSLAPDVRVFGFLFLCAVASAIAFGLVPAMQTTRTNVVGATRGEFIAAVRPVRLRNALVLGQITTCALLLVVAGVLLRGAGRLAKLDVGYRTPGVVIVNPSDGIRPGVVDRLRDGAGVLAVEGALWAPLDGRFPQIAVSTVPSALTVASSMNRVSPGYFAALGIPIVRGRTFSANEARERDAVVIVSRSAAEQLWPRGEAIGATIRLASPNTDAEFPARTARVIGVVGDVVAGFVGERRDHPTIYEPTNVDVVGGSIIVAVASTGALTKRLTRNALAGADPGGSIELHTLEESLAIQVYPFRAAYWVASALGAIALALTITGVYGVLAYVVAIRRKEISIRVALGATSRTVIGLVVRQSVRLALVGVAAGSLMAFGASRFIASRLSMIPAFDAVALGSGVAIVLLATLGAAYVPTRKAVAVDPVETLRD